MMHAAKYPSNHVGGYLIGAIDSDKLEVRVRALDSLPVLHGYPVGFTLELGYSVAAQMAASQGHTVVGYYYAKDSPHGHPEYVDTVSSDVQASNGSLCVVTSVDFKGLENNNSCVEVRAIFFDCVFIWVRFLNNFVVYSRQSRVMQE
jgi:hypothetical protein